MLLSSYLSNLKEEQREMHHFSTGRKEIRQPYLT